MVGVVLWETWLTTHTHNVYIMYMYVYNLIRLEVFSSILTNCNNCAHFENSWLGVFLSMSVRLLYPPQFFWWSLCNFCYCDVGISIVIWVKTSRTDHCIGILRLCNTVCGEGKPSSVKRLLGVCSPSSLWVCGCSFFPFLLLSPLVFQRKKLWLLSPFQWFKGLIFFFGPLAANILSLVGWVRSLLYYWNTWYVYNACQAPCEQWTRKPTSLCLCVVSNVGREVNRVREWCYR